MYSKIVFVLFSITFASVFAGKDDTVREVNGKRIHFIRIRKNWFQSQAECAKRGLEMLTIENKEENEVAADELTRQQGDFWIGLYPKYEKAGVTYWHWISTGKGTEKYTNFCDGAGKKSNSYCAVISHHYKGCWQDFDCFSGSTGFACQEKIKMVGEPIGVVYKAL